MYQEPITNQNGGHKYNPKYNKDSHRETWSGIVSLLFLVAALVTSFSCLVYVAVEMTDVHSLDELTGPGDIFPNVCMSCLRLDPYNLSTRNIRVLTTREVDAVLQCCAESPQQWSAMLSVIADGYNIEHASNLTGNLKSSPVLAHLQVPSEKITDIDETFCDNFKSVFTFKPVNNSGLREHVSGVAVLEKGLVILQTGPYFIYSEVSYNQRLTSEGKKWFSSVNRLRPSSGSNCGVLLQSIHTGCDECIEDFKSVYTAGVFHLRVGDFIQVFLSERDQVASASIGLTMLATN